ncbi:hypothetical protein GCM10008949_51500 [Deinococcus humi]|nr:hypothetical protein GCM10008949_51500 [Deinococcus humi]
MNKNPSMDVVFIGGTADNREWAVEADRSKRGWLCPRRLSRAAALAGMHSDPITHHAVNGAPWVRKPEHR